MNNIENKLKQEYYDLLYSQVASSIETLPYFENIKKYPAGSFLLGSYNMSSIIKEHNLHVAIATTKAKNEKNIKILSKVLYLNTCSEEKSTSENFENFLTQFKDNSYPDGYYKKFAAILPIDKLSNDLCQIMLDKNWANVIASLATFELILSKIANKFNLYAGTLFDEFVQLNTKRGEEISVLLLSMLDGDDKYDVRNGISDTVNIFVSFFNEIDSQFYSD